MSPEVKLNSITAGLALCHVKVFQLSIVVHSVKLNYFLVARSEKGSAFSDEKAAASLVCLLTQKCFKLE